MSAFKMQTGARSLNVSVADRGRNSVKPLMPSFHRKLVKQILRHFQRILCLALED